MVAKKKMSNFELLRMIAMFMIVLHHFSVHSNWVYDSAFSANRVILQLFALFGKVGVNCFVLISAYFLSASTFKKEAVQRVWQQTFFYSVTLTVLCKFVLGVSVPMSSFIKSFFPFLSIAYWFVNAYLLMYLFVPFFNAAIQRLDERKLKQYLLLFLVVFSIIQNMTNYKSFTNDFIWFFFLYLIGATLRIYYKDRHSSLFYAQLFVIGSIFSFIGIIICDLLSTRFPFFNHIDKLLIDSQGVVQLALAVCLFLAFKQIQIPYNRFITWGGSATFGIYLIHDHVYFQQFIWPNVYCWVPLGNPFGVALIGIIASIVIFIVCMAIELLRKKVVFMGRKYLKNKYEKSHKRS